LSVDPSGPYCVDPSCSAWDGIELACEESSITAHYFKSILGNNVILLQNKIDFSTIKTVWFGRVSTYPLTGL